MSLIEQIQKNATQLPFDKQMEVLDFIAFLLQRTQPTAELSSRTDRVQRIRKSLDNLARMQVFTHITDPVEWQRNIRKDRSLVTVHSPLSL